MKAERVDTWAADLVDQPGGLAEKLEALSAAKVDLEFAIARRRPERAGEGVVFVTPIRGAAQCRAARKAGFEKTRTLYTVRVEGANKAGTGAKLVGALSDAGLNLRGLSAAAIGRKFVTHIALDSSADATKALRLLKTL